MSKAKHIRPGGKQEHSTNLLVVQVWLFVMAALIFALVLVGGATRLTDSGLSITEWLPILGAIPPLNEADWQLAFQKYQQIPEYKIINKGMGLAAFKQIYWWEWTHRFLGRFVGLAFLVPFIWFWIKGQINAPLARRLGAIFILGGLQGALGWYMVRSGLVDRVDVSQYRLAAHLSLAVLLYGWILWTALGLRRAPKTSAPAYAMTTEKWLALGFVCLVFIQIILGAFVAGLDAGKGYNTWPLMDGAVIPEGLLAMTPRWTNLFENALTVQFIHRMMAYFIVLAALLHALDQWRIGTPTWVSSLIIFLLVCLQVGLGIWVLLARAPIDLSLMHQAAALVLFAACLWHLHSIRRVR